MRALTLILLSLLTTGVFAAKVKITDVNFTDLGNEGKIIISLDKETTEFPVVTTKSDFVQIALPGSFVWPKIEKKFTYAKAFDSKLMAYQFNKDRVRIRAFLPRNVEKLQDKLSMVLKGKKVIVSFPKEKTNIAVSPVKRNPAIAKKEGKSVEKYDESYLDKLLKEKEQAIKLNEPIQKAADTQSGPKESKVAEDSVNMALAANKKDSKGFDLMPYVGKFVGFLALVLLLFYGVVALLKKGAFKKGRLGFLNSTKVVEVLNTTYIGPKRSLLMIKAHNQVFLVGSSEKGLHMISELNDVSGLFKESEKQISGSNFDSTLGTASEKSKNFQLKEFLNEDNDEKEEEPSVALEAIEKEMKAAQNSHKAKFSDQIKNKIKDLKPLQ